MLAGVVVEIVGCEGDQNLSGTARKDAVMAKQIGAAEATFGLGRPALAQGEEPRQPAIGGLVLGQAEQRVCRP